MAKRKVINFELINRPSEPYEVLEKMMVHHSDLAGASIALAWRENLQSDKDGHLLLGKCVKASDLQRELVEHDFVILLNRDMWQDGFSEEQRCALMDHELCHATVARDKDNVAKRDERGRIVWRTRKHDIEEFQSVVERHGCYKSDLDQFARELFKHRATPLFNQDEGAPLAPAAVMGGTHQRGKKRETVQ